MTTHLALKALMLIWLFLAMRPSHGQQNVTVDTQYFNGTLEVYVRALRGQLAEPLPDAEVSVETQHDVAVDSIRTDQNGIARFQELSPTKHGWVKVKATRGGLASETMTLKWALLNGSETGSAHMLLRAPLGPVEPTRLRAATVDGTMCGLPSNCELECSDMYYPAIYAPCYIQYYLIDVPVSDGFHFTW